MSNKKRQLVNNRISKECYHFPMVAVADVMYDITSLEKPGKIISFSNRRQAEVSVLRLVLMGYSVTHQIRSIN